VSGAVEQFFEHLTARDWASFRRVLAPEVERVGPFGDRVAGRDRYIALLEEAVPADYRNDVRIVTYAPDGLSAFARVTEHLGYPTQALHFQEAYVFGLDDEGRVNRIEIFWQTPQYDPTGMGSGLRT
jgi:limonene-1,2-epoxide hydrolase